MANKTYSAHVQHPFGSGYMLGGGQFSGTEEQARQQAVERYISLVMNDNNPFGRNALQRHPESIQVLLIPGELWGPDMMADTGFCSIWNEDASNAYETYEPDYEPMPNPLYRS